MLITLKEPCTAGGIYKFFYIFRRPFYRALEFGCALQRYVAGVLVFARFSFAGQHSEGAYQPLARGGELGLLRVGREDDVLRLDIAVDDRIIATQNLTAVAPGHFFDMEYKIPASLTRGKTEVKVEFQAHAGMTAGGLYGCQMLKP